MSIETEHKKMLEALTMLVKAKRRKEKFGPRDMEYLGLSFTGWIKAEKVLKEIEANENSDEEIKDKCDKCQGEDFRRVTEKYIECANCDTLKVKGENDLMGGC